MEKQTLLNTDANKIYFKGHRLSDIMNTVPIWAIHRIEEFLGKDFIFLNVKDSESFLPHLSIDKTLIPAKDDQKGDVTIYDCLGNSRVLSKHLSFIINMYNKQGLDLVFAEDDYAKNEKIVKNSGLDENKKYCIVNTFHEDTESINIYTGPPHVIGKGLLGKHTDQPLLTLNKSTSKVDSVTHGNFHYSPYRLNENKSFYIDFLQSKFGIDSLTTDDGKNKEKINSFVKNSISRVKQKFCYPWHHSNENNLRLPFHVSYDETENKLLVYCGNGENPESKIPIPKFINEAKFLEDLGNIEKDLESVFTDYLFRKDNKNKIPQKLQTRLNEFCANEGESYSDFVSRPFSVTFSSKRNSVVITTQNGSFQEIFFDSLKFKEDYFNAVNNAIKISDESYRKIRDLKIIDEIDELYLFGTSWKNEVEFTSPFGDLLAPANNEVDSDWIFNDIQKFKDSLIKIRKEIDRFLDNNDYGFDEEIEFTIPGSFIKMCEQFNIKKTLKTSSDLEDLFSQFVFDTNKNTITFYSPENCRKLFECTAKELYNEHILAEKMNKFISLYKEEYDTETGIAKCIMNLIPKDFKDKVVTDINEWTKKYSCEESVGRIFVSNGTILFNNFYWNQDEVENEDDYSKFDNIYLNEYSDFSEIEEATTSMFALLGASTKSSNVNAGSNLTETIKSDANIVAKRVATQRVISLIKDLVISILGKTKKIPKADVEKFYNSAYGKAIVGISTSLMLKVLNSRFDSKYTPIFEEISEELRISSETEIASELTEKLTEMFYTSGSSNSTNIEQMIRVISIETEMTPSSEDDIEVHINNVIPQTAANN